MIKQLFAKIWPVGNHNVLWVRGWNRAVLEDKLTKKRNETTYKFEVVPHVK